MTDQQQPLWRFMQAAYYDGARPGCCDHPGYAAELRAVAEAARLEFSISDPAQDVFEWLEAEAKRAEEGQ